MERVFFTDALARDGPSSVRLSTRYLGNPMDLLLQTAYFLQIF